MAEATLDKVIVQLQSNRGQNTRMLNIVNDSIIKLTDTMSSFIDTLQMQQVEALERMREEERERARQEQEQLRLINESKSASEGGGGNGFNPLALGGLGGALVGGLGALVSGTSAFVASLEGIRGWETKALAGIDDLLKGPLAIADNIRDALANNKIIGKLTDLGFGGLKVAGAPITGAIGALGKLLGKFFLPVGIIFSLSDTFEAWKQSEGEPMADRIAQSAFAFIGDFIGAPLDLLKRVTVGALDMIFGTKPGPDGKYSDDTIAGVAATFIDEFSFEEHIKNLPKLYKAFFEQVEALFENPEEESKKVHNQLKGMIDNIVKFVMRDVARGLLGEETAKRMFPELFRTQQEQTAFLAERQEAVAVQNTARSLDAARAQLELMAPGGIALPDFAGTPELAAARAAYNSYEEANRMMIGLDRTGTRVALQALSQAEANNEVQGGDNGGNTTIVQDNSTNRGGDNVILQQQPVGQLSFGVQNNFNASTGFAMNPASAFY